MKYTKLFKIEFSPQSPQHRQVKKLQKREAGDNRVLTITMQGCSSAGKLQCEAVAQMHIITAWFCRMLLKSNDKEQQHILDKGATQSLSNGRKIYLPAPLNYKRTACHLCVTATMSKHMMPHHPAVTDLTATVPWLSNRE